MEQSAIEKELLGLIFNLRNSIRNHDRGVLIGFLMCCVPILPVTTIGLTVCLLNLYLINLGKLETTETKLIKMGLLISLLNLILGAVIFIVFYKSIISIDSMQIVIVIKNVYLSVLDFIREIFGKNEPVQYVMSKFI